MRIARCKLPVLPEITSGVKCIALQKERKKHGTSVGPPLAQFLHWRNSQSLIKSHRTHVSILSGLSGVGYGVGTLLEKSRSPRGPRRSPGPLFQALEDPAALPDVSGPLFPVATQDKIRQFCTTTRRLSKETWTLRWPRFQRRGGSHNPLTKFRFRTEFSHTQPHSCFCKLFNARVPGATPHLRTCSTR